MVILKRSLLTVFLLTIVLCAGCNQNNEILSDCVIDEIAEKYLNDKKVFSCKLISCGNYTYIPYELTEQDGDAAYWNKLMDTSDFYIDMNEVAEYSLNIVDNYESIAYMYGLDLQNYYEQILEENEDTFYQQCYEEGCFDVKKILLVGHIAEKEGIIITEADEKRFCEENNCDFENLKEDEILHVYVNYCILEQKVIQTIQKKEE